MDNDTGTHPTIILRESISTDDIPILESLVRSTQNFTELEVSVAIEVAEEYCSKGEKSGYDFLWYTVKGRHVGFCCFGPIPCTIDRYEIYWIVIDKMMQRTGIGTVLLREAERRIVQKGGKAIYLDTSSKETYLNARIFYEKNGYTQVTILDDFYTDGDHKIIYRKKIR
jgi:ribosomal protein S18 acetylase RimI-like enzyme